MGWVACRNPPLRVPLHHKCPFQGHRICRNWKLASASVQRLLLTTTSHPASQLLVTQLTLTFPRFGLAARVGAVMRPLHATLAVDDTLQERNHTVAIQRRHLGIDLGLNEEILFLAPQRGSLASLLEGSSFDGLTPQSIKLTVKPLLHLRCSG